MFYKNNLNSLTKSLAISSVLILPNFSYGGDEFSNHCENTYEQSMADCTISSSKLGSLVGKIALANGLKKGLDKLGYLDEVESAVLYLDDARTFNTNYGDLKLHDKGFKLENFLNKHDQSINFKVLGNTPTIQYSIGF